MATINLPQLPAWCALTDGERYWAGRCARKLDDLQVVSEWRPTCAHQVLYGHPMPDDVRYVAWALDSLLCALTHDEPVIAFRALVQAVRYRAEHQIRDLVDAEATALVRVERMLRVVAAREKGAA